MSESNPLKLNSDVNYLLFSYVGKPREWLAKVHGAVTSPVSMPISNVLGDSVARTIHRTLSTQVAK